MTNIVLQEKDNITAENFLNNNTDRDFIENLVENYRGINVKSIDEIKKLINKNWNLITELKEIRHNLAHGFINEHKDIKLPSFEKIELLFLDIQKMINILSNDFEHYTTTYSHAEKFVKEDIVKIIKSIS